MGLLPRSVVILSLFLCVCCFRFVNGRDVIVMYLSKRLELI